MKEKFLNALVIAGIVVLMLVLLLFVVIAYQYQEDLRRASHGYQ